MRNNLTERKGKKKDETLSVTKIRNQTKITCKKFNIENYLFDDEQVSIMMNMVKNRHEQKKVKKKVKKSLESTMKVKGTAVCLIVTVTHSTNCYT